MHVSPRTAGHWCQCQEGVRAGAPQDEVCQSFHCNRGHSPGPLEDGVCPSDLISGRGYPQAALALSVSLLVSPRLSSSLQVSRLFVFPPSAAGCPENGPLSLRQRVLRAPGMCGAGLDAAVLSLPWSGQP